MGFVGALPALASRCELNETCLLRRNRHASLVIDENHIFIACRKPLQQKWILKFYLALTFSTHESSGRWVNQSKKIF